MEWSEGNPVNAMPRRLIEVLLLAVLLFGTSAEMVVAEAGSETVEPDWLADFHALYHLRSSIDPNGGLQASRIAQETLRQFLDEAASDSSLDANPLDNADAFIAHLANRQVNLMRAHLGTIVAYDLAKRSARWPLRNQGMDADGHVQVIRLLDALEYLYQARTALAIGEGKAGEIEAISAQEDFRRHLDRLLEESSATVLYRTSSRMRCPAESEDLADRAICKLRELIESRYSNQEKTSENNPFEPRVETLGKFVGIRQELVAKRFKELAGKDPDWGVREAWQSVPLDEYKSYRGFNLIFEGRQTDAENLRLALSHSWQHFLDKEWRGFVSAVPEGDEGEAVTGSADAVEAFIRHLEGEFYRFRQMVDAMVLAAGGQMTLRSCEEKLLNDSQFECPWQVGENGLKNNLQVWYQQREGVISAALRDLKTPRKSDSESSDSPEEAVSRLLSVNRKDAGIGGFDRELEGFLSVVSQALVPACPGSSNASSNATYCGWQAGLAETVESALDGLITETAQICIEGTGTDAEGGTPSEDPVPWASVRERIKSSIAAVRPGKAGKAKHNPVPVLRRTLLDFEAGRLFEECPDAEVTNVSAAVSTALDQIREGLDVQISDLRQNESFQNALLKFVLSVPRDLPALGEKEDAWLMFSLGAVSEKTREGEDAPEHRVSGLDNDSFTPTLFLDLCVRLERDKEDEPFETKGAARLLQCESGRSSDASERFERWRFRLAALADDRSRDLKQSLAEFWRPDRVSDPELKKFLRKHVLGSEGDIPVCADTDVHCGKHTVGRFRLSELVKVARLTAEGLRLDLPSDVCPSAAAGLVRFPALAQFVAAGEFPEDLRDPVSVCVEVALRSALRNWLNARPWLMTWGEDMQGSVSSCIQNEGDEDRCWARLTRPVLVPSAGDVDPGSARVVVELIEKEQRFYTRVRLEGVAPQVAARGLLQSLYAHGGMAALMGAGSVEGGSSPIDLLAVPDDDRKVQVEWRSPRMDMGTLHIDAGFGSLRWCPPRHVRISLGAGFDLEGRPPQPRPGSKCPPLPENVEALGALSLKGPAWFGEVLDVKLHVRDGKIGIPSSLLRGRLDEVFHNLGIKEGTDKLWTSPFCLGSEEILSLDAWPLGDQCLAEIMKRRPFYSRIHAFLANGLDMSAIVPLAELCSESGCPESWEYSSEAASGRLECRHIKPSSSIGLVSDGLDSSLVQSVFAGACTLYLSWGRDEGSRCDIQLDLTQQENASVRVEQKPSGCVANHLAKALPMEYEHIAVDYLGYELFTQQLLFETRVRKGENDPWNPPFRLGVGLDGVLSVEPKVLAAWLDASSGCPEYAPADDAQVVGWPCFARFLHAAKTDADNKLLDRLSESLDRRVTLEKQTFESELSSLTLSASLSDRGQGDYQIKLTVDSGGLCGTFDLEWGFNSREEPPTANVPRGRWRDCLEQFVGAADEPLSGIHGEPSVSVNWILPRCLAPGSNNDPRACMQADGFQPIVSLTLDMNYLGGKRMERQLILPLDANRFSEALAEQAGTVAAEWIESHGRREIQRQVQGFLGDSSSELVNACNAVEERLTEGWDSFRSGFERFMPINIIGETKMEPGCPKPGGFQDARTLDPRRQSLYLGEFALALAQCSISFEGARYRLDGGLQWSEIRVDEPGCASYLRGMLPRFVQTSDVRLRWRDNGPVLTATLGVPLDLLGLGTIHVPLEIGAGQITASTGNRDAAVQAAASALLRKALQSRLEGRSFQVGGARIEFPNDDKKTRDDEKEGADWHIRVSLHVPIGEGRSFPLNGYLVVPLRGTQSPSFTLDGGVDPKLVLRQRLESEIGKRVGDLTALIGSALPFGGLKPEMLEGTFRIRHWDGDGLIPAESTFQVRMRGELLDRLGKVLGGDLNPVVDMHLDHRGFRVGTIRGLSIPISPQILIPPIAICEPTVTLSGDYLDLQGVATVGECSFRNVLAANGVFRIRLDHSSGRDGSSACSNPNWALLSARADLSAFRMVPLGDQQFVADLDSKCMRSAMDLGGALSDIIRLRGGMEAVSEGRHAAVGNPEGSPLSLALFGVPVSSGFFRISEDEGLRAKADLDLFGVLKGGGQFDSGKGFRSPGMAASAELKAGKYDLGRAGLQVNPELARLGFRFLGAGFSLTVSGLDEIDEGTILALILGPFGALAECVQRPAACVAALGKALEDLLSGRLELNPAAGFDMSSSNVSGSRGASSKGPDQPAEGSRHASAKHAANASQAAVDQVVHSDFTPTEDPAPEQESVPGLNPENPIHIVIVRSAEQPERGDVCRREEESATSCDRALVQVPWQVPRVSGQGQSAETHFAERNGRWIPHSEGIALLAGSGTYAHLLKHGRSDGKSEHPGTIHWFVQGQPGGSIATGRTYLGDWEDTSGHGFGFDALKRVGAQSESAMQRALGRFLGGSAGVLKRRVGEFSGDASGEILDRGEFIESLGLFQWESLAAIAAKYRDDPATFLYVASDRSNDDRLFLVSGFDWATEGPDQDFRRRALEHLLASRVRWISSLERKTQHLSEQCPLDGLILPARITPGDRPRLETAVGIHEYHGSRFHELAQFDGPELTSQCPEPLIAPELSEGFTAGRANKAFLGEPPAVPPERIPVPPENEEPAIEWIPNPEDGKQFIVSKIDQQYRIDSCFSGPTDGSCEPGFIVWVPDGYVASSGSGVLGLKGRLMDAAPRSSLNWLSDGSSVGTRAARFILLLDEPEGKGRCTEIAWVSEFGELATAKVQGDRICAAETESDRYPFSEHSVPLLQALARDTAARLGDHWQENPICSLKYFEDGEAFLMSQFKDPYGQCETATKVYRVNSPAQGRSFYFPDDFQFNDWAKCISEMHANTDDVGVAAVHLPEQKLAFLGADKVWLCGQLPVASAEASDRILEIGGIRWSDDLHPSELICDDRTQAGAPCFVRAAIEDALREVPRDHPLDHKIEMAVGHLEHRGRMAMVQVGPQRDAKDYRLFIRGVSIAVGAGECPESVVSHPGELAKVLDDLMKPEGHQAEPTASDILTRILQHHPQGSTEGVREWVCGGLATSGEASSPMQQLVDRDLERQRLLIVARGGMDQWIKEQRSRRGDAFQSAVRWCPRKGLGSGKGFQGCGSDEGPLSSDFARVLSRAIVDGRAGTVCEAGGEAALVTAYPGSRENGFVVCADDVWYLDLSARACKLPIQAYRASERGEKMQVQKLDGLPLRRVLSGWERTVGSTQCARESAREDRPDGGESPDALPELRLTVLTHQDDTIRSVLARHDPANARFHPLLVSDSCLEGIPLAGEREAGRDGDGIKALSAAAELLAGQNNTDFCLGTARVASLEGDENPVVWLGKELLKAPVETEPTLVAHGVVPRGSEKVNRSFMEWLGSLAGAAIWEGVEGLTDEDPLAVRMGATVDDRPGDRDLHVFTPWPMDREDGGDIHYIRVVPATSPNSTDADLARSTTAIKPGDAAGFAPTWVFVGKSDSSAPRLDAWVLRLGSMETDDDLWTHSFVSVPNVGSGISSEVHERTFAEGALHSDLFRELAPALLGDLEPSQSQQTCMRQAAAGGNEGLLGAQMLTDDAVLFAEPGAASGCLFASNDEGVPVWVAWEPSGSLAPRISENSLDEWVRYCDGSKECRLRLDFELAEGASVASRWQPDGQWTAARIENASLESAILTVRGVKWEDLGGSSPLLDQAYRALLYDLVSAAGPDQPDGKRVQGEHWESNHTGYAMLTTEQRDGSADVYLASDLSDSLARIRWVLPGGQEPAQLAVRQLVAQGYAQFCQQPPCQFKVSTFAESGQTELQWLEKQGLVIRIQDRSEKPNTWIVVPGATQPIHLTDQRRSPTEICPPVGAAESGGHCAHPASADTDWGRMCFCQDTQLSVADTEVLVDQLRDLGTNPWLVVGKDGYVLGGDQTILGRSGRIGGVKQPWVNVSKRAQEWCVDARSDEVPETLKNCPLLSDCCLSQGSGDVVQCFAKNLFNEQAPAGCPRGGIAFSTGATQ